MADDEDQIVPVPFSDGSKYGPLTPQWWLRNLATELRDRREGRLGRRRWNRSLAKPCRVRPGLQVLHDYLTGDPPLTGYAEEWGEAFRVVTRMGRLNVAPLIVGAKSSRMSLRGFQTSAASDEFGDQKARAIMRATKLKIVAREIHDFQLWAGVGYGMVTPPADGSDMVTITSEDPRQAITCHDPATGVTLAGLKMFRNDWDLADVAHLFIRNAAGKYDHYPLMKPGNTPLMYNSSRFADGWLLTDKVVTLGRMPLIRWKNRNSGIGEYEWHLDTIDRINDQVMDKLVIAKVQAFRQMAIDGLPDSVMKIVDGKPVEVEIDYSNAFEAAPGSLWKIPAGSKIWESTPTDIGPLRLAIKDDLQQLAAATQTSLPAITPDATQGSAEGASLQREEEVFAVEACRDYAEPSWAELMSTAFYFMNDEDRADVKQIQPMWGPIERYSMAEMADADSKSSLPRAEKYVRIWQYDPADVSRLRQLEGQDLLTQPAPTQPGNGVPAVTFQAPGQPPQDASGGGAS